MWTVTRKGTEVSVCDDRGNPVATVGDISDCRINLKLNHANLMASAPEMLEVLIDLQVLLRREYFNKDHPIIESLEKRCDEIVNKNLRPRWRDDEKKIYRRDYGSREDGVVNDHTSSNPEAATPNDVDRGECEIFYETVEDDQAGNDRDGAPDFGGSLFT